MHPARFSAMYLAPIPLRLVLAVTFIWAGLGKFVAPIEVQGERAALLANMGYTFPNTPTRIPTRTPTNAPAQSPSKTPEKPLPPTTADPEGGDAGTPTRPTGETPSPPGSSPPGLLQTEPVAGGESGAGPLQPSVMHTAADYPEPIRVRRLYGIALLTYAAAHPVAAEAGGTPPPPIWPEWAARGRWPIVIAWFAAITEVVAGVFVLVGLLTRLSALAIAGVMLTAMWLTELGPAIQSAQTILGFLPKHDPWDIAAWSTLLWQVALLGASVGLCFAGPGALSLDRVHSRDDDEFEDDDEDE